jgi:hypothetical protein
VTVFHNFRPSFLKSRRDGHGTGRKYFHPSNPPGSFCLQLQMQGRVLPRRIIPLSKRAYADVTFPFASLKTVISCCLPEVDYGHMNAVSQLNGRRVEGGFCTCFSPLMDELHELIPRAVEIRTCFNGSVRVRQHVYHRVHCS